MADDNVPKPPNIGAGSTGTTPPAGNTSGGAPSGGGGTGPPTGAGGDTGVTGSTPSHPPSVAPPKAKNLTWQQTPRGARMANAYDALHAAFQSELPSVRHQLQTLARRPFGG